MAGQVIQGFFPGGRMLAARAVRPAVVQPAVAGMPRPGPPRSAFTPASATVQQRPAPGQPLQMSQPGQAAQCFGGNENIGIDPVAIGLVRSGGQSLPQTLLAKMEAAFGADFSAVRVHVGPQAARIGAVAFTTGNDLYFAPGRYQPDTAQGQQLIGHELAHVIQQRQGRVRAPGPGVTVVQDRALESEADRLGARAAAHRVMQPEPRPGTSAPHPTSAAVQRRLAPPGHGRGAIQRMEMDLEQPKPAPRVLGINLHLSHGEALGNTGDVQTTTLEAKINGVFIGKFDNRASFMKKGVVVTDTTLASQFPRHICKEYWKSGTGAHANCKPHSEDFLLAALNEEFKRLRGDWSSAYPRDNGQNFDLLSVKMDKTCCPNCARNMMKACTAFGLRFREKASTLNTATNKKGLTGVQMLASGKVKKKLNSDDYLYNVASIPVRHWTPTQIAKYINANNKKLFPISGGFLKFKNISDSAIGKFPGTDNAELGWSNWGYGRKSGRDKW